MRNIEKTSTIRPFSFTEPTSTIALLTKRLLVCSFDNPGLCNVHTRVVLLFRNVQLYIQQDILKCGRISIKKISFSVLIREFKTKSTINARNFRKLLWLEVFLEIVNKFLTRKLSISVVSEWSTKFSKIHLEEFIWC